MDTKNPGNPSLFFYAGYFRKYNFGFAAQISYILNSIKKKLSIIGGKEYESQEFTIVDSCGDVSDVDILVVLNEGCTLVAGQEQGIWSSATCTGARSSAQVTIGSESCFRY